jgi:hypothetical protein
MFADADVPPSFSGIFIVDYPEDCAEFSDTIEQTQTALEDFKEEFEECLAFFNWAAPQIVALQEGICNADAISLGAQTAMINMMIGDLAAEQLPKIQEFLALADPANTGGLEGQDYLEQVLAPQLLPAINAGTIEAAEAQDPNIEVRGFCDPEDLGLAEFDQAAARLALQQTLGELVDHLVDGICEEGDDLAE